MSGRKGTLELFNVDAETSLTGAALLGGLEVLGAPNVKQVRPTDFWDKRFQTVWAAILRTAKARLTPDNITVADELRKQGKLKAIGGETVLVDAMNACPSWVRADSYAATVLEWSRQRRAERAIFALGGALGKDGRFASTLQDTLAELQEVAAESEPAQRLGWEFRTLADAYAERRPLEFVVADLLALPSLNVVYGAPGCLKSMLLTDLAVCVAGGLSWLPPLPDKSDVQERETAQVPVVWLDFDNGQRRTDERVEALAKARGLEPETAPFYYVSMPSPWLDGNNAASVDALVDRIDELEPGLIVIDNLGTVSGGVDENSAEMIPVLSNFRRLAEATGAAVVLIHHQRKATGFNSRTGESLRGHSSIAAALDLVLLVEREEGAPDVIIKSTKTRDVNVAPFGALFTYEHKESTRELAQARFWGLPVETKIDRVTSAILETVGACPDLNKTALVSKAREVLPDDTGINYIRDTIDLLAEEGQLATGKGSHNATLYRLAD